MPSLIIKCKTQNVKGETQNWAQCAEGGLSLEGFVFHSLAFFMSRTLRTRVPALGDILESPVKLQELLVLRSYL